MRHILINRVKALDFYGKTMAFFFMSTFMTYYVAVRNIIKAKDPLHTIELDLFTYIMPFISFIIDAAVKRAYHIQAQNWIVCVKVICIFFYLS